MINLNEMIKYQHEAYGLPDESAGLIARLVYDAVRVVKIIGIDSNGQLSCVPFDDERITLLLDEDDLIPV